jgi:hypothetical protein
MLQSEDALKPQMFQLAVNHRSHGGIVDCARSVVQLIEEYWPNAIDSLDPEHGIVDGCKPVFFTGWDQSNVRYEQFLFGEAYVVTASTRIVLPDCPPAGTP